MRLIIIFIVLLVSHSAYSGSLWWTEKMVSLRFNVNDISHQKLITLFPIESHDVLLFDVRRPEEYQMSRIEGGVRVSPKMTAQEFIAQYGHSIKNKNLIFYCSVGYRSSEFIQRIEKMAIEKGAKTINNLQGGIFRWYNEQHRVINDNGVTDDMHPSDESWADLINKRQ